MTRAITGFGVGLRLAFAEELAATARRVDWIEVTPENWVFFGGRRRRLLDACLARFPATPHAVSFGVGGPDLLDDELLDGIAALCRRAGSPWWSDHLCFASVDGPTHDLLPLPFTEEAIEQVAARAREAERRVGSPLLLENATYYAHMPGGTMDEPTFVRRAVEAAGCGLLLDVNNVYVNARNHGRDPRDAIDRAPWEHVAQLHVAGHSARELAIIDTHIGPVASEVWALYRYAIARAGRIVPTLIEWDQDIPALDVVLDEVDLARAHAEAALADPAAAIAGAPGIVSAAEDTR